MTTQTKSNTRKTLSIFSLTMITVGSVDSIRNLPATALFGSQLIFFFILGAIFFLLPAALISAELSSRYPGKSGIYVWVKEAFGVKAGFLAIWFQWISNVIWYPTILSFVAGTIAYLINPSLAASKTFLILTIVCAFWGATILNMLGMKSSARFSNLCAIAGLLIPMTLIIALGATWIAGGHALQIHFTKAAIMPQLHNSNMWVALTGIILSFCGIEIATVHASDVDNPQKAFPRALLYSVVIILTTLILGSLSIAIVLPGNDISLVAGIMQAFNAFFTSYHLQWMLPLVAAMLVLGGLGGVSNWIIAPTRGLLAAARDGNMPPMLQKENKHGAPSYLLIYQAVIVTALSMVFLLMPSVNGSYWLLTALAAQLYMFMYLFMFAAGLYLHFKDKRETTGFKIPGGNMGITLVSLLGIIGCTATVAVGFIPPGNIQIGGALHYEELLLTGLFLMCIPPFITYRYKRDSWFTALTTQEA